MYIVVVVSISIEEPSRPPVITKDRSVGVAGESRAREGCPSLFSGLDWFIFAFQTTLSTSIALGSLLVAFLFLRIVSSRGESGWNLRITFSLLAEIEVSIHSSGFGGRCSPVYASFHTSLDQLSLY